MANQGWPNAAGGGTQTSSTARTSGRGTVTSPAWSGSKIAHPSGGDNDPLASESDACEPTGQLSISEP